MFGATSSSRPGVSSGSEPYGGNSSYCPSTLVARNASSDPVCTPVTFEPTTSPTGEVDGRRSWIFSISGSSTVRKPEALAWIQPGRSTTTTDARADGSVGTSSPVNAATCRCASTANALSWVTAARASSGVTVGPGLTSLRPVVTARSQSTIEEFIGSPYVVCGPVADGAGRAVAGVRNTHRWPGRSPERDRPGQWSGAG